MSASDKQIILTCWRERDNATTDYVCIVALYIDINIYIYRERLVVFSVFIVDCRRALEAPDDVSVMFARQDRAERKIYALRHCNAVTLAV